MTLSDLKHVVDSVLPSKGIEGSMGWAKRAGKHKAIADEIYEKFDAAYDSDYG